LEQDSIKTSETAKKAILNVESERGRERNGNPVRKCKEKGESGQIIQRKWL
jgi:hypothetical protein